jgi:quercetin dioxygenase-like cupin family protein
VTADREAIIPIGQRLRAARRARRLTLEQVAEACDLTKGFVSKLERDQSTASVASLLRICDTLGLSIGELFEGIHSPDLLRATDYPTVSFGGERMVEYLLTPSRERHVQVLLSEIQQGGGSGQETYALPSEVEFALVLSGELEIALDGRTDVLRTGDALTFVPRTPHAFRNIGDTAARVLWVLVPALPTGRTSPDGHT